MINFIPKENFEDRLRLAISMSWEIFCRRVGTTKLVINKEASMQLQYALLLNQILPLVSYSLDEETCIELETNVVIDGQSKNIDIMVTGKTLTTKIKIAIELKCYKTKTSSGKLRSAQDIFMKDIYEDLQNLEKYIISGNADKGIFFIMTDFEKFANPRQKIARYWKHYDISHNHCIKGANINIPTGGKDISIELLKEYNCRWKNFGDFWFMELEGTC